MQALWNAKFRGEELLYGEAPNQFIQQNLEHLLPLHTVMCLGEGEGRNALFLAEKGLEVEALDASDMGLFKLRKRARAHYVDIKIRHTLIEYWEPSPSYGAVVCTYLHVPKEKQHMLFEKAIDALKDGGLLIAELFSESQMNFHSGGPKNSDLLYNLNDISDTLTSLPCTIVKLAQEIVVLNEGKNHVGRASVIRLIAQKTTLTH